MSSPYRILLLCLTSLFLACPAAAEALPGPTSPGVSSIVIDAASGRILSEHNAYVLRYPASLTKLMTLDLTFEALRDGRLRLDTRIPISPHAASVEPVKLGLHPGDSIDVREAILAMTTMSANDAATALGEYLGDGSEPRCAQMMTLRAHALGMMKTEFYNASGLPDPRQVTTAYDIAILAQDIISRFPEDQKFFEVPVFDFDGRRIYNIDDMLRLYPGANGMKTGFTDLARFNVVTTAVRNGHELIGVVLHAPSWSAGYRQMALLLDRGFREIANPGQIIYAAQQVPAAPATRHVPRADVLSMGTALQRVNRPTGEFPRVWTTQLSLFSTAMKARNEAREAVRHVGVGIPRVAPLVRDGHLIWNAQLAGLTLPAAYAVCDRLVSRHHACRVIASAASRPSAYHFAMKEDTAAVADVGQG